MDAATSGTGGNASTFISGHGGLLQDEPRGETEGPVPAAHTKSRGTKAGLRPQSPSKARDGCVAASSKLREMYVYPMWADWASSIREGCLCGSLI